MSGTLGSRPDYVDFPAIVNVVVVAVDIEWIEVKICFVPVLQVVAISVGQRGIGVPGVDGFAGRRVVDDHARLVAVGQTVLVRVSLDWIRLVLSAVARLPPGFFDVILQPVTVGVPRELRPGRGVVIESELLGIRVMP